jgi:tRNA modification GTPase
MSDTIYALSSAVGKAGVSVVRVSGDKSWTSLYEFVQVSGEILPRIALFKKIIDPEMRDVLDQALILPFKGPASFTGEDVVEYHLHGSTAVVDGFLAALKKQPNHRLAEPGEFTRRAFENGKIDLTEAEAIADLIEAETQAQRHQALHQMGGALSNLYNGWREELVRALAYVEAVIDFPDEDVPDSETAKAHPAIQKIAEEIKLHLNDNNRGERLRSGIQVAVIGAPNAGKSSLVNALARRDVAIVSPMAGTTRDVIEVHLDLAGYPVILADTAGLRPDQIFEDGAHGSVESEGIRRALKRAEDADIRVLVFDGSQDDIDAHALNLFNERSILVANKADLGINEKLKLHGAISISVTSQDGMDAFLSALTTKIKSLYDSSRDTPSLTRSRHRAALEDCLSRLENSMLATLPELMAEDLRIAARALGRITGRVDVEDLLDVIFRDFCIGK